MCKNIQAIRESLNKFDVKTTKTKHSILGAKPAKGSTGRPGMSKQAGIENVRIANAGHRMMCLKVILG